MQVRFTTTFYCSTLKMSAFETGFGASHFQINVSQNGNIISTLSHVFALENWFHGDALRLNLLFRNIVKTKTTVSANFYFMKTDQSFCDH